MKDVSKRQVWSSLENTEDMVHPSENDDEEQLLERAVLRLSGNVLGFVLGVLASAFIFVATNWLVLKGGSVVGPHLGLLSQYFVGYSVSFVGSLVGMIYAFVVGYLSGLIIAWVYNAVIAASNGTKN